MKPLRKIIYVYKGLETYGAKRASVVLECEHVAYVAKGVDARTPKHKLARCGECPGVEVKP